MQTVHRVLILEDHTLLRRAMAQALARIPNVSVAEAGTLRGAVDEVTHRRPQMVVSDLDLPDGSGVELLSHLGGEPGIPVLFVSAFLPRFAPQLQHHPNVMVREKPMSLEELQNLVADRLQLHEPDRAEAPFTAADYIQLACMGQHSVRIEIVNAEARGHVVVRQGEIWAAESDRLTAEAALSALGFSPGANVKCMTLRAPIPARNIAPGPWEQQLIEAARKHDEAVRSKRTPVRAATPVDELFDFSDIFGDEEPVVVPIRAAKPRNGTAAVPPSVAAAPVKAAPPPVRADESVFEELLERATNCLLNKDYFAALRSYEAARELRPDDRLIDTNIRRLEQLLERDR